MALAVSTREYTIALDSTPLTVSQNFLFANTPKGATGSEVIFSLIQTAIENSLDPYRYLTWLMKIAKDADLEDTTAVQALLPWNTPEECWVLAPGENRHYEPGGNRQL